MTKTGKINWKNVDFNNPDLLTRGLVAIEECTDYDFEILKPEKGNKRKFDPPKTSQAKKKKTTKKINVETATPNQFSPSKAGSSLQNEDVTEINSQQADDNADYLVWSNYNLPDPIIKALKEQGFKNPTEIQSLTLPAAILGKRDIIGAAETGSGKTLAFGLPILYGIHHWKQQQEENTAEKPLYSLILTPTRELAVQIKNHLVAAAKYLDIHIAVVVGGMAAVKQERILSKQPEIVVATPGRLWELIQQGNEHLQKVDDIKYLVIDETDRMLEKGHFEELHDLLERLNDDETKKKSRQNFVFSATLTLIHDLPKYLLTKVKRHKLKTTPEQKLEKIVNMLGITNPKIVDITKGTGGTSQTLTECRITCSIDEKDLYIYYFLLKHPGRTLIFCNSIGCVRRLTNLLSILGCHPLPLHASMQQRQRLKNLERFRDDKLGILVATDVAARGLDIPQVEHVLHYQTPRTSESYVHRSGRTARATQQGITVLLIEPNEIQNYIKLCKTLDKDEDLPIFPVEESYLNAVKERVNLARELDKLDLDVRKGNSEVGWFEKAAEEMDIIVDDLVEQRYDKKEISATKKLADLKRKQLAALLSKQIFPKGFSGKYPLSSQQFQSVFMRNDNEGAVKVMKEAIDTAAKEKRKNIPLFKRNHLKARNDPKKTTYKIGKNQKNEKKGKKMKRKR